MTSGCWKPLEMPETPWERPNGLESPWWPEHPTNMNFGEDINYERKTIGWIATCTSRRCWGPRFQIISTNAL